MSYGNPKSLPQHMIDAMSPKDRKELGLMSTDERIAKAERNDEREIQNTVEAYLVQLGYERRTPENIGRGMPRSGWFVHLHATKRNPILLDLLILSHYGSYLELELKTMTGTLSAEQEALVAQGASLGRGSAEATSIIRKWHDELREIHQRKGSINQREDT